MKARDLGRAAAAAALMLALAGAPAQAAGDPPAQSFVTCGDKGRDHDRYCYDGDDVTGVVREFRRPEIVYRQCVRKKGERPDCRVGVTRGPGSRPRLGVPLNGPGRYFVTWFRGGDPFDSASVKVHRRKVFLVGDSLSQGTKPYMPQTLPDWHFDQDVTISRHAYEGVDVLRDYGRLPGVVVMALGTNDDPRDVAGFTGAVSDSLDLVGRRRCLVWVNIRRRPVGGASYDGYNDVLDRFARTKGNFEVVDWHRITEKHPEILAGDGAHATQEGYVMRAVAIAKAIQRC